MIEFIKDRIKSLYYVFVGVWYLVRKEPPIVIHFSIILFFIFLGFQVGISKTEWVIQILCFGAVLTVESLNTAIEKVCDFIHPEHHKKIGIIKDVSAGAVGFTVSSVTIALGIIYYPYFFE